jgi:hypothetical protein
LTPIFLRSSKKLAVNAAKNLYQAGVDAAAGLVKGLESKQSDIRKAMEAIAREMILAIKKELKIKSPSEVFAEIGRFSMEGMAKGFSSSQAMNDAIDLAATDALLRMRKTMSSISSIVSDELTPDPVISPILDLTTIREQAKELAALTATTPITASASFNAASAISGAVQLSWRKRINVMVELQSSSNRTITHQKALSEIELYRQTKNQISQLKTTLNVTRGINEIRRHGHQSPVQHNISSGYFPTEYFRLDRSYDCFRCSHCGGGISRP